VRPFAGNIVKYWVYQYCFLLKKTALYAMGVNRPKEKKLTAQNVFLF